MAYVDPQTVVAPKSRLKLVEVLYNGGPDKWSVARLEWDGEECIGIRWNGSGSKQKRGMGNPQSTGRPTWFVVPQELADVIREAIEKFGDSKHAELLRAYREMAEDGEREAEATEWSEGLTGDAISQEG